MILVVTTETIPGADIEEVVGLVRGSASRTRHILTDFAEWMRNLVGMELHDYLKMMGETREQALDRLKDHAMQLGGNAIVGLKLETSTIAGGSYEVLAYGTAVRLAGLPQHGAVDLSDA